MAIKNIFVFLLFLAIFDPHLLIDFNCRLSGAVLVDFDCRLSGAVLVVTTFCFVLFDSSHPIFNLSVKQGRVFLGLTSTKLG